MATATDTTARPGTLHKVPGVELFATGTYRGKTWTLADLDEMAANAKKLGPTGLDLLKPPAVYGHEEKQDFLDNTGWPAAGWLNCDNVTVKRYFDPRTKRQEGVLVGDLTGLPELVARQIKNKRYRKVSAEIYDDFLDDHGNGYGKAIRRIALLGGEVPQVKRLKDLPEPVRMSEVRLKPGTMVRNAAKNTYICFAETVPMQDRTQLIAAAKAAMPNLSQEFLDKLGDAELAELVAALPAPAADPNAAAAPPAMMGDRVTKCDDGTDPNAATTDAGTDPTPDEMVQALVDAGAGDEAKLSAMPPDELAALYEEVMNDQGNPDDMDHDNMGDPATMTREDMIAELTAAGQDAAALDAMGDDELRALYTSVMGGATATAPAAAPAVAAMSDRTNRSPNPARDMTSTLNRRADRTVATANRVHKMADQMYRQMSRMSADMKRKDAHQFCEQLVRNEQATVAQVKAAYLPLLLQLDSTNEVHRFTEGGKTRNVSAYELKKAELAKLPKVIRFGEKMRTDPATETEVEVARVRRFAETIEGALKTTGKTPEQFVHEFTELRKKNPAVTAARFGVPAEFLN